MTASELAGLSWVATPGSLEAVPSELTDRSSVQPMAFDADAVRTACARSTERAWFVECDGWLYAFGFQLGLGAVARSLSKSRGPVLSFHNDVKYDVQLFGLSRDGELVRQISRIQGERKQEGTPLPGEPSFTESIDLVALSRAWGADVSRLEWNGSALLALPPLTRRMLPAVFVALGVATVVLGVRAIPSKAERCRTDCERTATSTYRNAPECRAVPLEQCEPFLEMINGCNTSCR